MLYDYIMMHLFPKSLQGGTLKLFYQLLLAFIHSFQQLVVSFINYFDVARPFESGIKFVLAIKQNYDETSKNFVRRF